MMAPSRIGWATAVKLALGLLGGIAAVVLAVGAALPAHHTAARQVVLRQPRSEVWARLSDFGAAASWRPDVERVEMSVDSSDRTIWTEIDRSGDSIPYVTVEEKAPRRLVRAIADPDLPFGGTWTFELDDLGGGDVPGTRVTLTERGVVPHPVVRFVSKVFIGHTTLMERYLEALGTSFGEDVEPRAVD